MRKAIIAAIVATALFAVGAFAANFTVNAEDVASGRDTVVACAPAVDVVFAPAQWDDTQKRYEIPAATIRFVTATGDTTVSNGCDSQRADYRIELGTASGHDGTDQEGFGTVASGLLPVLSTGTGGTVTGWPVSDIEGAAVLVENIRIPATGAPVAFGG